MPIAEIAGAIASVRSSLDLAKAMVGLRDTEVFRAKSIELQGLILDSLDKAITAREAQSGQLDRIKALETEVAQLKAWDTEKKDYELTSVGRGAMAYMLKPDARGAAPPHWLCPNCFTNGKKAFFQPAMSAGAMGGRFVCPLCSSTIATYNTEVPRWNAQGA